MANDDSVVRAAADHRQGRTIRLLWLIDSLTLGGAEALVVPFARRAAESGFDLTVCARKTIAGNPLEPEIRASGAALVNLEAGTLRDLGAFRRLLGVLRRHGTELIHAHLTYAAIWGALAARRTGIPLVASLHVSPAGAAGLKERAGQKLLVGLLNRYAARTIFVSAALAGEWRRATSIRAERMTVLHNGIPTERLAHPAGRDQVRPELGLPDGAPVVMTVSVLREGKGIDVLLRAALTILQSLPSCRFVVVGDGPLRSAWEGLGRELGVAGAVVWTGFRRDVDRLLSAADLFVLPTLRDAFPTVVLEAMAAGKPVVATAVGGIPEMLDPATGRLVPPGDQSALAAAVRGAIEDAGWRTRAGKAAAEKARARFSTEAWMARLRTLYEDVLRRGEGDRA